MHNFIYSDHENDEATDVHNKTSLSDEELQRILYPQYFELLPTFFGIDPNNVDELIKYWKLPGKAHYNQLQTKVTEIQSYDLKETIVHQDEFHNNKLSFVYNMSNHHSWNTDYFYLYPFMYDIDAYPPHLLTENVFYFNLTKFKQKEIGHPQSRYPPKYDVYEIFSANNDKYQRIISKQAMYAKHEKYLRQNYRDVELIFPENDTLLFAMMHKFGQRLKQKLQKASQSPHGGAFLHALQKLHNEMKSSSSSSSKQRRRLEGFGILDESEETDLKRVDLNKIDDSIKAGVGRPRIQNFNGLTADISYFHRNKSTVKYLHNFEMDDPIKRFVSGNMDFIDRSQRDENKSQMYKNYKFWRLHEHCVRRKSTTIYPNWRILYASKPLT